MKNKIKIFVVMLCVIISMLSFNVKAGCPYLQIPAACTTPDTVVTFSNVTYHLIVCIGIPLDFNLWHEAYCDSALISTDVSAGYAPCASSFPGPSGPVMFSSAPFGSPWNWTCTFNTPGTYQYILCITPHPNGIDCQCSGCITLIIDVIDHIPFTFIDEPSNNCPADNNGPSMYTLVIPPAYAALVGNISWQLNGMTGNYFINTNTSGTIAFVDYDTATFDNGLSAELCAYIETCCTTDTVCIPIYKCCECDPNLPTLFINNRTSNWVLTDTSFANNWLTSNIIATPQQIVINGQFIIDDDIVFADCPHICMGPEARIFIQSGRTLTFSSPLVPHTNYSSPIITYVYATDTVAGGPLNGTVGCGIMWDGIYFEDSSAQLIINPVPSSPATDNYAYLIGARNAIVSDYGAEFAIRWATLASNNKGIVVNTFTGQGAHPGTIDHSILTTSSSFPMLPYYTPNTTTVNSALQRTNIGIEINNVDEITIGAFGSPSLKNNFDKMDIGIFSNNSYLKSRNNWFLDMHRITACPNPFISQCAPEGVGIYSKSTTLALIAPALEVGGSTNENYFLDVDDGVYTDGPQDISISYNVITNVKRGIYVTRNYARTTLIFNNTIDQFNTGIWTVYNPACYIEINHNVLNGFNHAVILPGTGIKAEEPQQNAQFSSIVKIHDNVIHSIRTGIHATNLVAAEINNFNEIRFETAHPNTWNASYGIRVQNNDRTYVWENTVYRCANYFPFANPQTGWPPNTSCFPGVSSASTYTKRLIGISMEKSVYCDIFNNSTAYLGTGIHHFASYLTNTYACNTMAYCEWMLWIDNGDPGQQGDHNTSQGNQWRSGATFNVQYDAFGTPSTLSNLGPWYVSSTSLPDAPQIMSPPVVLDLQSAQNPNNRCSYPAIIGDSAEEKQDQLANLLDWTQKPECTLTEEGKFIMKVEIYKELLYDTMLMKLNTQYDDSLQNFYDDEAETNIGITAKVRYYIDAEDYEEAENANSAIAPENQADENEQTTNEIYLHTWADEIYTYTEEQYNSLDDIAKQNPISGGPAVYTARVMLGVDYDDFGDIEERLSTEKPTLESFMYIYPNPADDILNISYSLGENATGELVLTDLLGREIIKQNLNSAESLITISTKNIEGGVYFVSIKLTDAIKMVEKMIIAR